MKSVLISIRPKWCELIANGKKTIEVRKTRPKLETPFKCYIYCTKSLKHLYRWSKEIEHEGLGELYTTDHNKYSLVPQGFLNGKVIGEFVCDDIKQIMYDVPCSMRAFEMGFGFAQEPRFNISLQDTCLSEDELFDYLGEADDISSECYPYPTYKFEKGFAWHISNLIIYDKPKELREFYSICLEWDKERFTKKCEKCNHFARSDEDMCYVCDIVKQRAI